LTQAAEQIKSGQELTVLNVNDLEEVALIVGTARFNVGLAGKAAFFRKMHEKIATMTDIEKEQIVADARTKTEESRSPLEKLMVGMDNMYKMNEKIATMTDIEKAEIVAAALNKPTEKRTGLENFLVKIVGNEGKKFLVLFNYFLYINFLINF
jgi:hypothetical protein